MTGKVPVFREFFSPSRGDGQYGIGRQDYFIIVTCAIKKIVF